jgi:hypothetical protein
MHMTVLADQIVPAMLAKVVYPDAYWHYREIPVNGDGLPCALELLKVELREFYGAKVEGEPIPGYALHMVVE